LDYHWLCIWDVNNVSYRTVGLKMIFKDLIAVKWKVRVDPYDK